MITGLSIPSKKRGARFYGPLLSVPARAGLTVLTAALVLCAPVSAGAADAKPDAAQLIDRVINAHRAGHFQQASDAVDALIALRPARADYRLEKLRLTALTPGENKPGLSPQLEILCSSNDGRVCEQARFVAQLTQPRYAERLRRIFALEKDGKYAEALAGYDALFGGAPGENGLMVRYWRNMLHTPRVKDAEAALALLAGTAPTDPLIGRRAAFELKTFRLNRLSVNGLRDIVNPKKRQRAAEDLSLALLTAPEDSRAKTWRKALDEGIFRIAVEKARDAVKARELAQAESWYLRALPAAPAARKTGVMLDLDDIARQKGEYGKAGKLVERALSGKNSSAELRREKLDAIYAEELASLANIYEKNGNRPLLIYVLRKQINLVGETPVLVRRLAQAYLAEGDKTRALALFESGDKKRLASAAWAYAYAVTLYGAEKPDDAIDVLTKAEGKRPEHLAFLERLITERTIRTAKARANRGEWQQALKELNTLTTATPDITSLRADWASRTPDKEEALRQYRRLFDEPQFTVEAHLSAAAIALELGRADDAAGLLDTMTSDPRNRMTIAQVRKAVATYGKLGRTAKVRDLYKTYSQNIPAAVNRDYALFNRDKAAWLQERGDTEGALTAYRQAFVNAGLTAAYPADDRDFTRAMLSPDTEDDWMRSALRLHSSLLYQNDNVIVTTGYRKVHDEGTPGYSDTRADIGMVQMMMPAKGGTLTIRSDTVRYDMGELVPGEWESMTGTCFSGGCNPAGGKTRATGSLIAAAWDNGVWAFDIGTTPIGFHYTDITGALSYSFNWGDTSLTAEAYRRAKDASLLAYGGQRDPATGKWWGGVRRTGVSLSASRDDGTGIGLWGKISAETIRGRNVADNTSWQAMGTAYTRLISKPNHEFTPSFFVMLWGFDKDLSGYTFGQGGYYSPQRYVGFNISLNDTGRTENWTWRVTATAGRSYAKTEGIARYPLPGSIPAWQKPNMSDLTSVSSTSADWSNSWSVQANLERRLGSHVSVGAAAGISRAPDYNYRWGLVYLRWYIRSWEGNLPMPVPLLVPYSER